MVCINDYLYLSEECFSYQSFNEINTFAKIIGVIWHENAHKAVRKLSNNFAIFSKDSDDYLN